MTLRFVRSKLFVTTLLMMYLLVIMPVSATEITVGGACTLADAIINANNDDQSGSINCPPGQGVDTISLSGNISFTTRYPVFADGWNALPSITSPIVIQGNGFLISRSAGGSCSAIASNSDFRFFHVGANGDLRLNNVIMTGGCANDTSPDGDSGGAIINIRGGNVVISNSTLQNNRAIDDGGAMLVGNSTATILNSTFSLNTASSGGGAIYNFFNSATSVGIDIINSTFSSNIAEDRGGALFNNNGSLINITNSVINNNTAQNRGGAIENTGGGQLNIAYSTLNNNRVFTTNSDGGTIQNTNNAVLNMRSSTISNGEASRHGGGIHNSSGAVTLTNVTLTRNTALYGGGLYNNNGAVNLFNTTIIANRGIQAGGGFRNNTGTLNLSRTLIIDNTPDNCGTRTALGGISNIGNGSCPDQLATTATYNNLANNGGPTQTMALTGTSATNAAINNAAANCTGAPTVDQRGYLRDASCDIGAFEAGATPVTIAMSVDTTTLDEGLGEAATVTVTLSAAVELDAYINFGGVAATGDDYIVGGQIDPTTQRIRFDGTTTTRTFTVAAVTDADAEGSEQLSMALLAGGVTVTSSDLFVTIVEPAPELAVTKSANTPTTTPGGTASYTVTVTNNSPSAAAAGVQISDSLPAGFTYTDSVTPNIVLSGGATRTTSVDPVSGSATPTWGGFSIPAGGSVAITFTANVGGSVVARTYSNSASATTTTADANITNFDGGAATSDDVTVQNAILTVAKVAQTTAMNPGGTVLYTVTATNTGDATANDVQITDTLPTGFTYTNTTPSTIQLNGGTTRGALVEPANGAATPTWGDFTIPSGGSVAITFAANVDASVANGVYSNSASVTTSSPAADITNFDGGASTADDVTISGAVLNVTKDANTATTTPGGTASYSITVSNNGNFAANDVQITDTLPAGFTYTNTTPQSIQLNGGATRSATVDPANGAATPGWGTFTIPAGGSVAITFTANVGGGVVAGTYSNSASATTSSAGATINNFDGGSTNSDDVTVQVANLTAQKTANTATALPGGSAAYTLLVSNNGSGAASGITITDTLPGGFTLNTSSAPIITLNGGATRSATVDPANGAATPTWGDFTIPAGGSVQITFTVDVAVSVAAGVYSNSVSITTPSAGVIINNFDGAAETSDDVTVEVAVLAVAKASNTPTATAGGSASYTLVVSNTGGQTASDVEISDMLPGGFTYDAGVAPVINLSGGATRDAIVDPADGTTDPAWGSFTIPAGGSVEITFTAAIGDAVTPGLYNNSASVTTATTGTSITNFDGGTSAQDDVTINAASLVASKTATTAATAPGSTAAYAITVENTGSAAAEGVAISDSLPAGFSYTDSVAPVITLNGGATRTATVDPTSGTDTPTWGNFAIPAGGSVQISFTVDVAGTVASGSYDNSVTVTSTTTGISITDFDGGSTTTDNVTVNAPALAVDKVATVASTLPGDTAEYRLTIANTGLAAAEGVAISDSLPAGFSYTDSVAPVITLNGGATRTATVDPASGATTPTWGDFSIPAGGSVEITFTVDVANSVAPGTYSNSASATTTSAGATISDFDGSASLADDVTVAVAALVTTKEALTTLLLPGDMAEYRVTVENTGSAAAEGVAISDSLPAGFSYTDSVAPAITLNGGATRTATVDPTSGATTPTWGDFTIPAGGSVEIVFSADVAPTVGEGTYDNSASTTSTTASASLTDFDGGASTMDDVTIATPGLTVLKEALTPTVNPGDAVRYLITVINTGGIDAADVEITDDLPNRFTYDDTTAPVITLDGGATRTATLDPVAGDDPAVWGTFSIPAGASVSIEFEALAAPDAPERIYNNSASVTTSTTGARVNNFDGASSRLDNVTVGNPTPPPTDDDADEDDNDEDDNSGSTQQTVAQAPEISVFDPAISKLGLLTPGQLGIQGERLTWVVTVTNSGSVAGQNVVITDTLVAGLRIDGVEAPGGSVSVNGQTVSVTYGTLAPGASVQFQILTTSLDGALVQNTACVNADNAAAPECVTASVVTNLPLTGETPWWRVVLLRWIGVGGLLIVLTIGLGLRRRRTA